MQYLTFYTLFSCLLFSVFSENRIKDKSPWKEDLFGSGLTEAVISKEAKRHIASSTEDLKILYQDEQLILKNLQNPESQNYLEEIGNLTCFNNLDYVLHPINAFHLMKRSVQKWPKLAKKYPEIFKSIEIPEKRDFIFGAAFGMLSIWAFHDLNILDLAKGLIIDPKTKVKLKACKELSAEELQIIATTAKKVWRLNGHVDWLKASLKVSKARKKSPSYQSSLKKAIKK